MINIGLPKGGMKKKSLKLVELYSQKEINQDLLSFQIDNVRFLLLKHRDIAKMLGSGELDYGLTSLEWINETNADVNVLYKTNWCNTRISLISPIKHEALSGRYIKCITEFPNISNKYFDQIGFKDNVLIKPISGSSEALVGNLYDCCIDCVETGKTLKENDLKEEAVIFNSKIVFATTKQKNKEKSLNENFLIRCINELDKNS